MYLSIFFGLISIISLFLFIWISIQAANKKSEGLALVAIVIMIVMFTSFASTYDGLRFLDGMREKVIQSKPEKSLENVNVK